MIGKVRHTEEVVEEFTAVLVRVKPVVDVGLES